MNIFKSLLFFTLLPIVIGVGWSVEDSRLDSFIEYVLVILLMFRLCDFFFTISKYVDNEEHFLLCIEDVKPEWYFKIKGNLMWVTVGVLIWFSHPWFALIFTIIEGFQIVQEMDINKKLIKRNNER